MAIGLTPQHAEQYPLNELTQQQFLVLALETAEKLAWKVAYVSQNGFIAYADNGLVSSKAEIRITIEEDIVQLKSLSTGNELTDRGKNKEIIAAFIENFEAVKLAKYQEDLATKYALLQPHFPEQGADILTLPPPTFKEKTKDFFSIFIPTKELFVTPLLIDVNILIFIAMVLTGVDIMSPSSQSLISWGANYTPDTLGGEWWRLLTCCFLHIGIIHLLMNMYALLYIGVLLEPILGRTRFIVAYLLTGITASLTSLWWHFVTVSAGASGAIFGMYGVFLALLTTKLIEENERKALLSSIGVFVAFNLMYGMQGGIDNAAHIGGLVGGLVIGYAFLPSLKDFENSKLKYTTIGLTTAIVVATSVFVYKKIPNNMGIYTQKMTQFGENEEKAMSVYQLPQDTPKDTLLANFKNISIPHWKKNVQLIDEIAQLKLPDNMKERNQKIKKYCALRLSASELSYKALVEKTTKYDVEIEKYYQEVAAIMKGLEEK
jgi:rhomboid protease GluP